MKAWKTKENVIYLPTTNADFDQLVSNVVRLFRIEDRERAEAVIANEIQHLPRDQATTTLRYLGHCIIKNQAYQVARERLQKINHEAQVDQIIAALKANPHDQQARDALDRAAGDGSSYAKAALAQLEHSNLTLVPKPAEDTAPPRVSSSEPS